MRQKTYNEVPPETIIRHMAEERGKLQAEISELKDKLARKDAAIAAFKKWQAKVAEYHWSYWLREGIQLMETPPDKTMLNTLNQLLGHHRIFETWKHKVMSAYESYEKAKEKAKRTLKPIQDEETD